ncbi:MAG: TonB-dependent receptor domain-containing protein [Calditrichia bacterium]
MAYTRGQNLEWDKPLPEIPPLEAKLTFRYTYPGGLFWIEADGRFAARQERISKSFGETETPGFTVYNLLASIKPWHFLELHAGVRNIFNKTYYEHLNRRYRNQPLNSVVWEPGRTVVFLFRLSY